MRNIFGWSYPPGCNSVPGDEPSFCDVCGMVDNCCCPECPVCGEQGNPACYQEADLGICGGLHKTGKTPEQLLNRAIYDAAQLKERWQDAEQYVGYLKDQIERGKEDDYL